MTREEAIKFLKLMRKAVSNFEEYGHDKASMVIECDKAEAIDMAIESLSADTVSREEHEEVKAYMDTLVDAFIEDGEELAESVKVVRCKDCRFWKNEHLCLVMSRYGSMETKAEHFCSWGERAEQTEYKMPGHDEVMEALDKLTLRGGKDV